MLSRLLTVPIPLLLMACQPQVTTLVEGQVDQRGAWAEDQQVHLRSYDPETNDSVRIASADVWPDGSFSALVPHYDGWMMLEFEDVHGVQAQALLPPSKQTGRDELTLDHETSLEAGLFLQLDRRDASTHAFVQRWVRPVDDVVVTQPHMADRFDLALAARDNAKSILTTDPGAASEARLDSVVGQTLRDGLLPMELMRATMVTEVESVSDAITDILDDPRAPSLMESVEAQAVVDFERAEDHDELERAADRWREGVRDITFEMLDDDVDDPRLIDTIFVLGELHREPTLASMHLGLDNETARLDDTLVVELQADRRELEEDLAIVKDAFDDPEAIEDLLYVWVPALAM